MVDNNYCVVCGKSFNSCNDKGYRLKGGAKACADCCKMAGIIPQFAFIYAPSKVLEKKAVLTPALPEQPGTENTIKLGDKRIHDIEKKDTTEQENKIITDQIIDESPIDNIIRLNTQATAEDVEKKLILNSRLRQTVELMFMYAKDQNMFINDWKDVKALAEIYLDKSWILDELYIETKDVKELLRLITIAQGKGIKLNERREQFIATHVLSLEEGLVRYDDEFHSLANRKRTPDETDYLRDVSEITGLATYDDREMDKDFQNMALFYEGLAGELWLRDGVLNEYMISYAFDIAIEYAYGVAWFLGKILKDNPKKFNELFSIPQYGFVEKPVDIPKCNINELPALIRDYQEKGTNDFIEAHRRRFPEKKRLSPKTITATTPINIHGDTTKEKGIHFEEYCVELLKKRGFTNISTTSASGDHGIDILAESTYTTYAIQCKYYSGPVGNFAVQEAFSGKAYYDRDIAVVMTNSVFTQQAVDEAAKLKVKLWDGNKLREMQN